MRTITKVLVAGSIAVAVVGCASTPPGCARPNLGGAVVGGVAGGVLGAQVGSGTGRTAAAAVGAGTGAVIGSQVGCE